MKSIWVVAHDATAAAELVDGARCLAPSVSAVVVGTDAVPGADLTVLVPAPASDALLEGCAGAVAGLLADRGAGLVLFGTDLRSRLLAGAVAAHLHTSVRNATDVRMEGDAVCVARSVFGGLAVATERLTGDVAVLVVGPNVLAPSGAAASTGAVEQLDVPADASGLTVRETRAKQTQAVNLAAAQRVVGVGRGFAAEADLDLARQLAAKLGAEVACSRPIAEGVGWLPVERYLGVSGATIRPDLYLAVGISGQVQHMVGVNRSKTIVAINKDKNAPVFAHADYGIVGDLYAVLPALVQAL